MRLAREAGHASHRPGRVTTDTVEAEIPICLGTV